MTNKDGIFIILVFATVILLGLGAIILRILYM